MKYQFIVLFGGEIATVTHSGLSAVTAAEGGDKGEGRVLRFVRLPKI